MPLKYTTYAYNDVFELCVELTYEKPPWIESNVFMV